MISIVGLYIEFIVSNHNGYIMSSKVSMCEYYLLQLSNRSMQNAEFLPKIQIHRALNAMPMLEIFQK